MPKNTRKGYGLGNAGPLPDLAPMPQLADRNPTTADNDYELQTVWINNNTYEAFMYTGPGIWEPLGASTFTGILTLTGDTGGAIPDDGSNNINIIGGTNVTVNGNIGTNTLTINASIPTPESNFVIATGDLTMSNDTTYCVKNSAPSNLTTLTLPAVSILGDMITVVGYTIGGWQINQNVNNTIFFGTSTTTPGIGGSLASTNAHDTISLQCVTDGLTVEWQILNVIGDITVT